MLAVLPWAIFLSNTLIALAGLCFYSSKEVAHNIAITGSVGSDALG